MTPVRLDMKRLFLLVFAVAAGLRAEPVSVVLDKLYAKLAAAYQSTAAMGQGKTFLVLANPGFPLGKINLADDYEISQLADRIPLVARLYQPSASTYSDTYRTIISQSEASNFVDQTARQAALTAKRQLWDPRRPGRPTPAYASYLQYQAACADAQDALSLAETEQRATGSAGPPELAPALEAARKNWETLGNRKLIDDAQTALDSYAGSNPKAQFSNLLADFTACARRDGHPEDYPVLIVPPPSAWKSEDGWRGFRFTQSEKSQAPAAQAGTDKPSDEVVESVHIGLEVKRVNFKRPWLDETIFKSQRWRLLKSCSFATVSTGNPADKDPGRMPLLITGILLARNVRMSGRWKQRPGQEGGPAFGPIRLPAKPSQTGETTITDLDPQIIAFICTVLPKSPNPDDKAFRH